MNYFNSETCFYHMRTYSQRYHELHLSAEIGNIKLQCDKSARYPNIDDASIGTSWFLLFSQIIVIYSIISNSFSIWFQTILYLFSFSQKMILFIIYKCDHQVLMVTRRYPHMLPSGFRGPFILYLSRYRWDHEKAFFSCKTFMLKKGWSLPPFDW